MAIHTNSSCVNAGTRGCQSCGSHYPKLKWKGMAITWHLMYIPAMSVSSSPVVGRAVSHVISAMLAHVRSQVELVATLSDQAYRQAKSCQTKLSDKKLSDKKLLDKKLLDKKWSDKKSSE